MTTNPSPSTPTSTAFPTGMGECIRERRRELGLTQELVATEAGISRAHLSQIESGKIGMPGAPLRRKLAAVLNLRHVDLLIAAGELTREETGDPATPPGWRQLLPRLSGPDQAALLTIARRLAECPGPEPGADQT